MSKSTCTIIVSLLKINIIIDDQIAKSESLNNKTLQSVHFGVVVVELINCKCGGVVRNQIW